MSHIPVLSPLLQKSSSLSPIPISNPSEALHHFSLFSIHQYSTHITGPATKPFFQFRQCPNHCNIPYMPQSFHRTPHLGFALLPCYSCKLPPNIVREGPSSPRLVPKGTYPLFCLPHLSDKI